MNEDYINKYIKIENALQVNIATDNGQIYATLQNNESNKIQKNVKSRTQEYADKWNDNMFLNNFDERDENAGINIRLSEVYLEEHLPHYMWKESNVPQVDLKTLLSEYIVKKDKSKMLLVLGQPGIGKSTLITWITSNFNNCINDILVYQFASDLKNINWKDVNNDDYDISNEILDALGLSYDNLKGKTLIIDGFDEINAGKYRVEILNKLFWKFINKKKDFSLIITCRENYIMEFDGLKCNYITLCSWDEKQIKSFVTIYEQKNQNSISKETLINILKNKVILGIPLILYMVLALNIKVENEGSIVTVYDQIFALKGGIYDRCINNISFDEPHRVEKIKMQIHEISRKIALWMFENNHNEAYITQKEYIKICNDIFKQQYQVGEIVEQDFLIGSYFNSVKHCEGIENIYFVHRSIYEYFVVEYIFDSMYKNIFSKEMLAKVLGELLKGNVLNISYEILRFLQFKIRNSKLNWEFQIVFETLKLMLKNGMIYYTGKSYNNAITYELNVFANMLELIHIWENKERLALNDLQCHYIRCNYMHLSLNLANMELTATNLAGALLRGANLRGTDLSEANLKGADLANADLQGADLRQANLIGADLTEADLEGADLERANLTGADLRQANLRGANLRETNFREVNLRNVKLDEIQTSYLVSKYHL